MGNFYECALSLSCPLAANLVLLETEPWKFEEIQANSPNLLTYPKKLSQQEKKFIVSIQKTSTAILLERSLSIDRRLLMLGLYCDKLYELLETNREADLEKIQAVYQNSAFLQEEAEQFSSLIKFNAHNHIEIMIKILENLYGKGNAQDLEDRKYIDAVINFLHLKTDGTNHVKISELATNYISYTEERQKFMQRFSTIFENYLVNEWFVYCYPFRFNNTTTIFNYGVFVAIYKLLELLTFANAMEKFSTSNEYADENYIISAIVFYANRMDHRIDYAIKIIESLTATDNVIKIMKDMLQV